MVVLDLSCVLWSALDRHCLRLSLSCVLDRLELTHLRRQVKDVQLPIWGLILSLLVSFIYILPSGFIFAMTSQLVSLSHHLSPISLTARRFQISINILVELIAGYMLPGAALGNMVRPHTILGGPALTSLSLSYSRFTRFRRLELRSRLFRISSSVIT